MNQCFFFVRGPPTPLTAQRKAMVEQYIVSEMKLTGEEAKGVVTLLPPLPPSIPLHLVRRELQRMAADEPGNLSEGSLLTAMKAQASHVAALGHRAI